MKSNSTHSNNDIAHAEDKNEQTPVDISFFDKEKNVKIILNSFYAICALLVLLDFVVHRHIYVDFEKIPAFYAIYGFVACVLLVVLAKLMRVVLMRPEDYYDDKSDEQTETEEQSLVAKEHR